MDKKSIIFVATIIIISLLILGALVFLVFFWRPAVSPPFATVPPELTTEERKQQARRQLDILTALTAFDDQPIEGVIITKTDNKKLIRNQAEDYVIEMPSELIIARSIESSRIKFYQPDKTGSICENPACSPLVSIRTMENPERMSLGYWTKAREIAVGYPMFKDKEVLYINNEQTYRIEEETLRTPPAYYYFLAKGGKVYEISIAVILEPVYREYIASFRFE